MVIIPITLREANEFISLRHRHLGKAVGCKFALGLADEKRGLIGVAVCGRPVSRYYDNGETLEICRVCTDGTYNSCSMLYGACVRVGRAMGYRRIITYTLESEHGSSVKAANFKYDGIAGGIVWSGKRRNDTLPAEMKKRWVFYCK